MTTAKKKSGKKTPAKSRKGARGKPGTGKKAKVPVKKNKIEKIKNEVPEISPEKKMGRPPVPYDPLRHPEWVRGLASRGSTRPEICQAMGISRGTLNAWMKKYPDFLAALQVGRNETIARLHNSLIKKALGFSIPVTKTEEYPGQKEGDPAIISKVIRTEEYFPPDVRAATILLVNLDPKFKTDRAENKLTGDENKPITVKVLRGVSMEDL